MNSTDRLRPRDRLSSELEREQGHVGFGEFYARDSGIATERQDELLELDLILRKRTRNNALLVGEPGSGKSHLVAALAARIGPAERIFRLDVPRLMAGTKYRGELEAKFSHIVAASIEENFILFIDEMHALVEMGSAEGGFNILDLLKPQLTDPRLRMIGATTDAEVTLVARDPAFRRRFSMLKLAPMSRTQLEEIFVDYLAVSGLDLLDGRFDAITRDLTERLPDESNPDLMLDFLEYLEAYRQSSWYAGDGLQPSDALRRFGRHRTVSQR